MAHPGGRPLTWDDPVEFDNAIQSYFDKCDDKDKVPTTAGLADYLGFEDRRSLYDYKGRTEFSLAIKRAIGRIEAHHEANLEKPACAGSIFWLKNHKWTDKTDLALSTPDGPLLVSGIEVTLKKSE